MQTPKLSILILTYNRLPLSMLCIPQILDNIGDIDYEVLIWDNCSNDGTLDWLIEFGKADYRVTEVYAHGENIGVEAINYLAEEAKGKYLLKIDDDVHVPRNFAQRLVDTYEEINEEKLVFLGWDMEWSRNTFATRSGLRLYKKPLGKIIYMKDRPEKILINFFPGRWLINGVCRLSPKDKFLEIGGHPKGGVYGVDKKVSERAQEHGYWTGFLHTKDPIKHLGIHDSDKYRKAKNRALKKIGAPLHV